MPSFPNVHTERVWQHSNVTNEFSNKVPDGFVWVIRTITVAYGGLLSSLVNVYADKYLVMVVTLFTQPAGPSTSVFDGYLGLNAGEQLHVIASKGQGVDVTATGYVLSLP